MISTLFSQFRHQYANGSLITELLTTHGDQYLVKATVSLGEQVVATALAADADVATADDRAKARVLAMIGFAQDSPQPIQEQPAPAVTTAASKTDEIAKAPAHLPEPAPTVPAGSDDDDMGRPLDSFTPEEAPAPSEVPASSIAAMALENFDDSHPVDLSDIIAQTDVEMARLGWSSLQGRQYLEKTFNKRSRQQLTDEELLTFLLYLESQPTPSMTP